MDNDVFEDKESEEFDNQVFGGEASNQPLTVTMRRIRKREVIIISWKVESWKGWEHPRVFGRRYENHIPTTMLDTSENENPSKPVVPGSSQRTGTTGELKLVSGQTTYFGFWLEGKTLPKPKFQPSVWKDWNSPELIAFPVYMPLRADSLEVLRERRDVEKTKGEIRKILRAQEEKPTEKLKEEPQKRNPAMERINKLLEETQNLEAFLAKLDEAAEKEQAKMRELDVKVASGVMSKERAEDLKFEYEQAYKNIRGLIQTFMTGEPHA